MAMPCFMLFVQIWQHTFDTSLWFFFNVLVFIHFCCCYSSARVCVYHTLMLCAWIWQHTIDTPLSFLLSVFIHCLLLLLLLSCVIVCVPWSYAICMNMKTHYWLHTLICYVPVLCHVKVISKHSIIWRLTKYSNVYPFWNQLLYYIILLCATESILISDMSHYLPKILLGLRNIQVIHCP